MQANVMLARLHLQTAWRGWQDVRHQIARQSHAADNMAQRLLDTKRGAAFAGWQQIVAASKAAATAADTLADAYLRGLQQRALRRWCALAAALILQWYLLAHNNFCMHAPGHASLKHCNE